jgi:hypothetical protein
MLTSRLAENLTGALSGNLEQAAAAGERLRAPSSAPTPTPGPVFGHLLPALAVDERGAPLPS